MIDCTAGRRGALLAAIFATRSFRHRPRPPRNNPVAAGPPLLGRPDTEAAKKLAPVAPPPLSPPPTSCRRQAQGAERIQIELYASGVDNARTLRLGDKGTVFVSSRIKDKIHAIVDKNGKREVKVIASGLYPPERHRPA